MLPASGMIFLIGGQSWWCPTACSPEGLFCVTVAATSAVRAGMQP